MCRMAVDFPPYIVFFFETGKLRIVAGKCCFIITLKIKCMLAKDIPAYEASFLTTGIDSEGKAFTLEPFTINMPGDAHGPLHAISCKRKDGDKSFYFEEVITKERIVLHFTQGFIKGDIATLTKTDLHVSVPFIIARDGNIYNLWESKFWSNHLGPGAVGGNANLSKKSVAIEMSNVGPLKKVGDKMLTDFGAVYCNVGETTYYTALPKSYRGYSYYATHTDAQYTSLITLLRFLTNKYAIPRVVLPEQTRYDIFPSDAAAQASRGIVTHVNFRPSGEKVDIGPAFDWNRVIGALV